MDVTEKVDSKFVLRQLGILLAVAPMALAAQETGTIQGFVRIEGTDGRVTNARVTLVNADVFAETDQQGYFAMTRVPVGTYTVLVQAIGYQPQLVQGQSVAAGTLTVVDVELGSRVFELDPVEVRRAPSDASTASTSVNVLRGADLPPGGNIVAALRGRLPGFNLTVDRGGTRSIASGNFTARGATGRKVLWVLDGVTVTGNLDIPVSAGDVECIEVRRGSRSVLEFLRGVGSGTPGDYGAVVLVWTKANAQRMRGACA